MNLWGTLGLPGLSFLRKNRGKFALVGRPFLHTPYPYGLPRQGCAWLCLSRGKPKLWAGATADLAGEPVPQPRSACDTKFFGRQAPRKVLLGPALPKREAALQLKAKADEPSTR